VETDADGEKQGELANWLVAAQSRNKLAQKVDIVRELTDKLIRSKQL